MTPHPGNLALVAVLLQRGCPVHLLETAANQLSTRPNPERLKVIVDEIDQAILEAHHNYNTYTGVTDGGTPGEGTHGNS